MVIDRKTKEPAGDATGWVVNELVEGLICMHSGYMYNRLCFAPRGHPEAEIDRALQILDKVLGKMEREFGI